LRLTTFCVLTSTSCCFPATLISEVNSAREEAKQTPSEIWI